MTTIPVPVEIRAPLGAQTLEIDWSDGGTSFLPHRLLRAFCPCAHCQGHQGPIRYAPVIDQIPAPSLDLQNLEEVGNYALRLVWADGHATGIYAFRYLLALSELGDAPDSVLRTSTFER
ncbi:MAG: DUF971 domain-containing protein [Myxococcota bacterium]